MKKMLSLLLALSLLLGTVGTVSAAGTKVIVDGKTVNGECIIQNGRVLAPVRAITEAMGATVQWDEASQKATIKKFMENVGYREVLLWIGRDQASIDGMLLVDLNVPAQVINGRTMIPVRDLGDLFECQVDWDQATMTATISSVRTLTPQEQAIAVWNATQNYLNQVNSQGIQERPKTLSEIYGVSTQTHFDDTISIFVRNDSAEVLPARDLYIEVIRLSDEKVLEVSHFTVEKLEAGEEREYRIDDPTLKYVTMPKIKESQNISDGRKLIVYEGDPVEAKGKITFHAYIKE